MDSRRSEHPRTSSRLTVPEICRILLLGILASSCKDSVQLFQPMPEPTEFRKAILPLAIGNSWQYVDSSASYAFPTRTDSVVRFRVDQGIVWWTINYQPWEYAVSNGAVLSLPYKGHPFTRYIPTPASGDTVILDWQTPTGDEVYAYASTASWTVPAGTFDSCTVYEYHDYWARYRSVVKPGIGVIYSDSRSISNPPNGYRSVLLRFRLVK